MIYPTYPALARVDPHLQLRNPAIKTAKAKYPAQKGRSVGLPAQECRNGKLVIIEVDVTEWFRLNL